MWRSLPNTSFDWNALSWHVQVWSIPSRKDGKLDIWAVEREVCAIQLPHFQEQGGWRASRFSLLLPDTLVHHNLAPSNTLFSYLSFASSEKLYTVSSKRLRFGTTPFMIFWRKWDSKEWNLIMPSSSQIQAFFSQCTSMTFFYSVRTWMNCGKSRTNWKNVSKWPIWVNFLTI